MRSGQEIRTDAGGAWFFDAGRLCLDFAHTGGFEDDPLRVRPRGRLGELLASPADLDEWLSTHTRPVDVGATDRELTDARSLRAAIARLAVAIAPPTRGLERTPAVSADDIDTVNLFAALPDVPPVLPGGRRRAGTGRVRLAQALSTVARDAVALFEELGLDSRDAHDDAEPLGARRTARLGRCTAEDCGLVFYDASRGGTRRWCAMQRCGNRAKVRAHRERAER